MFFVCLLLPFPASSTSFLAASESHGAPQSYVGRRRFFSPRRTFPNTHTHTPVGCTIHTPVGCTHTKTTNIIKLYIYRFLVFFLIFSCLFVASWLSPEAFWGPFTFCCTRIARRSSLRGPQALFFPRRTFCVIYHNLPLYVAIY